MEPSLSRPLEGPPEKPPFAEPWVDFKVPPEEQALFAAEGTDKHQAEVQRTADVWKNEHSRQVADEAEQQELEAQAFQGRRKEDLLDWSDAPEKALPLLPTVGGSSAVEEKAPTALLKDSVETSEITSSPFQSLGKGADGQKDNAVAPSAAAATTTDSAMSNINSNNVDTATSPAAGIQSQQAAAKQQRNEIYQIRHVNWFDASSPVNPRRSPIMVQNANGPCPLLALVNALVLSTPADITTALVETLRVREQVSLGLLLDAVIDELMSGRRGDAAQNLPDVSELYAFLINLHTGMNVNPRFVEPPSAPTHLLDDPIDGPPDHQAELRKAGGFEDTPHMRLYSTFAVPLVHGWLPRKNHPVCDALRRCAETYEDAQSLLFAEEDLENKLEGEGLTPAEQRLLEDIATVKHFLTTSPTQLTEYGLDTIADSLKPGSVAILFRNDHFSTLYKQPRSGRIFTLVTDMGYAGHDEVVWESLVDIGGEGSEFFSGDFRPVGNNVANNRRSGGTSSAPNDGSWTTVSRHNGRRGSKSSLSPRGGNGPNESTSVTNAFSQLSFADGTDSVMPPGTTEQEDHDLALAMQLQEEEEDRHRQESTARRRRENELSQTYLDSASRSNQRSSRPEVPPRGGGARRAPPRNQTRVEDAPPPTYEQAAKGPAYQPSSGNSPHTGPSRPNIATTGAQGNRPTRQTSAYSQTNTALTNANRPRPAGRQPQAQKDKDCVVM